ncbi:MAG TPA: translin family protein [Candidatus Bathyarchaeia archaeon]|nr:translin family protein [Candidatus Bathyarchaeia archaeon]
MSLKKLLGQVRIDLKQKEEAKEEIQKSMRQATRLSKQAILLIHQRRLEEARRSLKETDGPFSTLTKLTKKYPELFYSGLVSAAFQEYTEAQILFRLVENGQFIGPEELNVPSIDYVLGLADVIGELRRRALDMLRKGNVKTAEECLKTMEEIFSELTAMDDAYMLIPGLRRKCDVARHVIEITRGEITIEARRASLERSIRKLEKAITMK